MVAGVQINGVRAFDPNLGVWTTPDAYEGDVHDPASQQRYMFNRGNAVDYSDPTGYAPAWFVADPHAFDRLASAIWDWLNTPVSSSWSPLSGPGCTCSLPQSEPPLRNDDYRQSPSASAFARSGGSSRSSSVNQMNKGISQGSAPRGITRVDKGKIKGEQDHVHFSNGAALNKDGTWKHGSTDLTSAQKDWLRDNGWRLPKT
jgi:RHS repeat-associated protein